MGWKIERFLDKRTVIEELLCPICTDVLDHPVHFECQHLFCKRCIKTWFEDGKSTCPVDRHEIKHPSLKPARLANNLLSDCIIRCKYFNVGCGLMTKFKDVDQLLDHEKKHCIRVQNRDDAYMDEYEMMRENNADQQKTIENQEFSINSLREKVEEQREQHTIDIDIIKDQKQKIVDNEKTISNLIRLNLTHGEDENEEEMAVAESREKSPKTGKHPWQY